MGELIRRSKSREFSARLGRDHDMHMLPNLGIKFSRPLSFKAHVHPRCIARPILQKKKTFRVVENRCSLQRVESIFVNLPQLAKSGLKESLNRFFWGVFFFTSFWIFWSGIKPFCFCECLFHCSTFNDGAIETYAWKTASTGVAEVHSSL